MIRNLATTGFVALSLASFLSASTGLAWLKRSEATLPPLDALTNYHPPVSSVMLDGAGAQLATFAEQRRTVLAYGAMPKLLVQAFVSAEDRNFWQHGAIDPAALMRAALTDVMRRHDGQRLIGASTITQQVIKNLVVGDQASLSRKVREALLAMRAEQVLGKQRILALYLNDIYLGHGAYGIAAAAETYFHKPAQQLDVAEAALLAAMPKGPRNYDPATHPDAARARRAYVLGRMCEDGGITATQRDAALAEPLPGLDDERDASDEDAAYFQEAARQAAVAQLGTSSGASSLYRDGLTVHTSLDRHLQHLATTALQAGLVAYDERHGYRGPLGTLDLSRWQDALGGAAAPDGMPESWSLAVVLGPEAGAPVGSLALGLPDGSTAAMPESGWQWAGRAGRAQLAPGSLILVELSDGGNARLHQMPEVEGAIVVMNPRTGGVLAEQGGFSFDRSRYDRALQSARQPGSTVKPFIYLTAFENGFTPDSPVLDVDVALSQGDGQPLWRPGSDGGAGWGLIPARRALMFSRNLAAVHVVNDVGLPALSATVSAFGLYPSLDGYSAALGAVETTDLKLTAAYAEIANGGHHLTPTLVTSIAGADGRPLFEAPVPTLDDHDRIAPAAAIAMTDSVLHSVVSGGTGQPAFRDTHVDAAGKTGTSNDERDAWFVGYAGGLAVGVHVGFDMPRSLGENEMGAEAAAPIAAAFLAEAVRTSPAPAAH